jgi:uncharacterized protein
VSKPAELAAGAAGVYRYFRLPHAFSSYSAAPQECHFCRQARPGYRRPFYGEAEIDFVCEPCLVAGRLAEVDAFTNDADLRSLREGVERLHPEFDPAAVDAYCRERTHELVHRTPGLVTWQDFLWPAHCDDYCVFLAEVGKPSVARLAADGDGPRFLATHLQDPPPWAPGQLWEALRPDSPADARLAYPVAFYLFQCRRCGGYRILWDAE